VKVLPNGRPGYEGALAVRQWYGTVFVCNDSAGAKLCRLPSTSIWVEEDRSFCQTKPRSGSIRGQTSSQGSLHTDTGVADSVPAVPAEISTVPSVDAKTETEESVPAALGQPKSLSGDKE
jgi:hypothetical protein